MEERDKRRVGEQVEPGGRPKAPGRLELLQRFVNTHNHDFPAGWDRLGTAAKATAWLRQKELIGRTDRASAQEAAQLRALREAVRSLVLSNHGGDLEPGALAALRDAAAGAPATVAFDDAGRSELAPAQGGVPGAVATLLGILHDAQADGHWTRLKGCRQCGYAFYDRSKNRSAAWCSMAICGNRTKNRAYHRRRRSG
jgi:predicted RNA-binding Zn ribbon-like protein